MSEQEYKKEEESANPAEEPEEISFTDKIVGIFTEPTVTFKKISSFPVKATDWVVPYVILLVVIAVCNMVMMKNPEIRNQVHDKQIEVLNKRLTEEINSKKITPEQADQQREMAEKQFEMVNSPVIMAVSFVSTIIFGFIIILIVVGYFYLFSKFVFKEASSYKDALVANALTSYISIISVIISTILALYFGRMMRDVSAASLFNSESGTFVTYLLNKVDLFSIWGYIVFSIGLTQMFKSANVKKYFALVFGSWIGWSLLFFILSKSISFFKNFAG